MQEPPKVVEQEVVKRERGITMVHPGVARSGRHDLPVLGAFGEFIETERRRSRNRMLLLAGFFIVILIAVVGAGLFIGMVLFDRMDRDLRTVEQTFEDYKLADAVKQNEADTALTRMQSETKNLHENLSQQEDAMALTRDAVDGFRSEYRQELVDLKRLVGLLDGENKSLRKELALAAAQLPALRDQIAAITHPAVAAVGTAPDPADWSATGPVRRAPPTTADGLATLPLKTPPRAVDARSRPHAASFELQILAAGKTRPVAWRLPIPE